MAVVKKLLFDFTKGTGSGFVKATSRVEFFFCSSSLNCDWEDLMIRLSGKFKVRKNARTGKKDEAINISLN